MSTKSTIILSKDNEHWYSDCAAPRGKIVSGKVAEYYGDDIFSFILCIYLDRTKKFICIR